MTFDIVAGGMMIGAGVFLGIGNTIAIAGPGGVILTFALNGIVTLFTAMSYAELMRKIEEKAHKRAIY